MPTRDKISQLPKEVRAEIDRLLIQAGFSGYEGLEQTILEEHGFKVGKSSLHRYGQKLERRLAAIRASTEAAKAIAQAAPDDEDHRSAAVISLVQSELFDVLLAVQEANDTEDQGERVGLLTEAAKAIDKLTNASLKQKKHESVVRRELREQMRQEDAEKIKSLEEQDRKSGKRGLDPETLRRIREEVYGIVEVG